MTADEKASILVVDDNPAKRLALVSVLEQLDQNLVISESGRDTLRLMLEHEYAVILMDVQMPDMDGFETAALIRSRKQSEVTPIIFVTAYARAETDMLQGYSGGAVDYVFTPIIPEILRAKVSVFVDLYQKIQAIKRHEEHLEKLVEQRTGALTAEIAENARLYAKMQELARTDALTGLNNRGEFQRQLKEEEERSRRYNRSFSLLILDIDHFKTVNDSYGHQAGDEVLRALAARLREQNRPVDHAARYGGDELVVILPETTNDGALALAERLRTAVADTAIPITEGRTISVTISIGVATFPADAGSETALIAAADKALYAAKQGGRNRISGYEPARG